MGLGDPPPPRPPSPPKENGHASDYEGHGMTPDYQVGHEPPTSSSSSIDPDPDSEFVDRPGPRLRMVPRRWVLGTHHRRDQHRRMACPPRTRWGMWSSRPRVRRHTQTRTRTSTGAIIRWVWTIHHRRDHRRRMSRPPSTRWVRAAAELKAVDRPGPRPRLDPLDGFGRSTGTIAETRVAERDWPGP